METTSAISKRELKETFELMTKDQLVNALTQKYLDCRKSEQESPVYSQKFIYWLSSGNHPFVYWLDESGEYFTDEISDKKWTIQELFTYWNTNIKDK